MPAAPDFRLYHGNSLDVLAGLLSEELRTPAPGMPLLAPDTILIPQPSMRRWLQVALARAHGIAANLRFLTPGEFVRETLDLHLPDANGHELDVASLHWRLHAALTDPAVLREPALVSLRGYLDHADPLRAWSLAGELAQVFEKYQAWRRDWLLAWENGVAADDPQAALWRHVAQGHAHRARRIDAYLRRYGGQDAPVPTHLPTRLFAFACLNVSPDVLRVIATQARAGVLHFYLPTPTRKYWGDLRTLGERLRAEGTAFDAAASNEEAFGSDNPLLQAWGAAGRDFMAVLGGYDVVHPSGEIAAYAEPQGDGLLQRLQRDLLDRNPVPPSPWRGAVDTGDASLQFHSCHTRQREIEVLHDQLRALFEDPRFDPPLQPREVAVLAPDIDLYAPAIAAVFGGSSGRDVIPYAITDNSPLAAEPLADVFLRLLALPLSRFGLHETMDLLSTPSLMVNPVEGSNHGLDLATLDMLRATLVDAGARWGLDAMHRVQHDAPHDDSYTWQFAMERLLLGAATGTTDMVGDIAAWPALEGSALDALDLLLRRLRLLQHHAAELAQPATPPAWSERLLGLLDDVLPARPGDVADQATLARLREAIAKFRKAADDAAYAQAIAPEIVRAHFRSVLGTADTRAPLLGGGISFGRMVPMRLLPFRVICVLGMNDGDYPRRDPSAGLNRLAMALTTTKRRHGDRSLRDDDRFLFLQLFAAASEVFYVSWLGADPRDGSVREPSVLVSELLEVASCYHADAGAARAALPVQHALQPFSPAAFGAATDEEAAPEPRRFSYRGEWLPPPHDDQATPPAVTRWITAALPDRVRSSDVSLDALRIFLLDPPRAFLRQRLDLRQAGESETVDDHEPLVMPRRGLQRQQLQEAVFAALLDGDGDDLHARLQARAWLPAGPLGTRQLDTLRDELAPYAKAFLQWREGEASTREFEVELDGRRLHGQLDACYPHGLARMRFGALHGPSQIRHGLDWLVASALDEPLPLVQFAEIERGFGPHLRAPLARDAALDALRALLELHEQGLHTPLPFLPRAGLLWYADDSEQRRKGWDKAARQWQGEERSWGEATTASARLALRGQDPFSGKTPSDEALGDDFRRIAGIVFAAVIHGRVDAAP